MKTKLGLLLLMLLIAVGCDDSTETEQPVAHPPVEHPVEQPTEPAKESITNTLGMSLKLIPAGTFLMGTPESEAGRQDDEHQHQVTISKPFYMQTTEVTQGQWKALMGTEPWKGEWFVKEGPSYAASYVNWDDATAYCKKLSEKEGKTYRLPTEAEWEYACRAGTTTTWSFGKTTWRFGYDIKVLGDYAWYDRNASNTPSERYVHQVGLKKPNAFGLYDMHGGVAEWCHDYYGPDYYKQSPAKDPQGPRSPWRPSSMRVSRTSTFRVVRGGSWGGQSRSTRSAYRKLNVAATRHSYYGFRLVRELD